ncbi:MAG TPA: TIR domain-containing protein [Desulfosporosinus sp.]|nr:TIR domain-containing protein [Desulfosporosinus sp.]
MAKKSVFISYDYDNDKKYKNLLLAWDANSYFDFSFKDTSVDISIDSTNSDTISRKISDRIGNSTYFLCIIGKKTYKNAWVKWEISKAVEFGKKVVAVKIDSANTLPDEILGVEASFARYFSFELIKKAIDNAR